jgi:hypothetical protein
MSSTSQHFFEVALTMRSNGEDLGRIGQRLLADGATPLDLVRVVRKIEGVEVGEARRMLESAGVISDGAAPLTIVVPEDDPWYDELIRSQSNEEGHSE